MKILICDDHELFRDGLREALRDLDGAELLEAGDAAGAFARLEAHPDLELVLLDLDLPGPGGFEVLARLRREAPGVGVVIVSASERAGDIRAALDAGALGFIPKASPRAVIVSALRLVRSGGVYVPPALLGRREAPALTPRQLDVLQLVAKGLTNKEIARVLGIGEGTVKVHVAAVLEALEATNRTEAVSVAGTLGLLDDGA